MPCYRDVRLARKLQKKCAAGEIDLARLLLCVRSSTHVLHLQQNETFRAGGGLLAFGEQSAPGRRDYTGRAENYKLLIRGLVDASNQVCYEHF